MRDAAGSECGAPTAGRANTPGNIVWRAIACAYGIWKSQHLHLRSLRYHASESATQDSHGYPGALAFSIQHDQVPFLSEGEYSN
jgi:hypothetical protein